MKNTTLIGNQAEALAVNFLKALGHSIITQNERTRYYELDIVSQSGEYIVLTEVKYRKNPDYGGGLEAVSNEKSKRLKNGFTMWLSENPKYSELQPRIDVVAVDATGHIEHIENAIF
jgi:putative endonuclease